MRNVNTAISYGLRAAVGFHACYLGTIYLSRSNPTFGNQNTIWVTVSLALLIIVLLVADWSTRKNQLRPYSKTIDSAIGIGWILAICMAVIWSLSMGTL